MAEKKLVGRVTHYFANLGVAVVELTEEVKVGDKLAIEGATTKIEQKLDSMQIDKNPVEKAGAGQSIGLKTKDRVRPGDVVYKLME
jgi:putative protease